VLIGLDANMERTNFINRGTSLVVAVLLFIGAPYKKQNMVGHCPRAYNKAMNLFLTTF
jgi:hypothetical protein